ncbi:TonB-linked SusC/RagA family outer membrane protein [Flavobacterium sp. 28A]|uniref:SusC/RagA family TonB-linked outer membrane protein n=1 Tax=Flavobacterium sp. 28A TaxID=2735895 RepID=UPI00156F26FF|nr:SusC/RagA family TonB-linked outer membrane protein [Flavobacterium sp. 28A]NRT15213.1 TonB-linked SusC/RagA family outer membrane protein [Flavobacterium sp. 28A]
MRLKFKWIYALLMALSIQFAFAQEQTIKGVVSDAIGSIPGVNVLVKGTKKSAQTDFDGGYVIKAKPGDVIVFSFVGMQDFTATVGTSSTINVKMKEEGKVLEEVVILGYVSRGKNEVTGSVKQISGDILKGVPVVSVDQALQGKVAGLQISQSSGTPGSVQDIRIRGVGSVSASNQPLYVIDGVPVINDAFAASDNVSTLSPLASIASSDIESMTVLKDASATSAYGARGSNGVIIITTKKGKSGKTVFNLNTSIGFQNNAVKGQTPLTGEQRKELYLDAVYNTYGADNGFTRANAETFLLGTAQGLNIDNNFAGLQYWDGKEGNWPELLQNKDAILRSYDISASGGDEKSTFNVSLGYNKTEGTVIGSEFRRLTAKIGMSRKLTENVKFSTNNSFADSKQNGVLEGGGFFSNPHLARYFMTPWANPYNADGSLNITDIQDYTGVPNTLYVVKNNLIENDLARIISNNTLEWRISDRFKYKSVFGIDYNLATFHQYDNPIHGDGANVNGDAQQTVSRNLNLVAQNSLNYNYRYKLHSFDATALFEYQKNTFSQLGAYGENFASEGLQYVDNVVRNISVNGSYDDWLNVSYLALLNYNYNGKYVLDFTYRKEGSSRFAPGKRFGDFWSVGTAWNINKEEFMNDGIFSELKLRGSVGSSGNNAIDLNQYQTLLAYNTNYAGDPTIYPSTYGNLDLQWEKNRTIDLGVDFAILNNRISGSLGVYNKKTSDLLQDVPLSRTSGFTTVSSNVGEIVNKGVEADLTFNVIQSKDFNWNVSTNYAFNDNEVTKLAKDPAGNDINIATGTKITKVGEAVGTWNMRKWAGVDSANGNPLWFVNGKDGATTSNYNEAQIAIQGKSLPTYTGGVSTHLDFKGVFFDASVYFAGGNKVFEDWASYTQSSGTRTTVNYNGVEALLNRWQNPGDITDVPKMDLTSTGNNSAATSTRFLYDGDYIRIKDLTLGYSFNKEVLEKISLDGLTLSVRGTNLFTFVKDGRLKYDPEVRADGFTRLSTPPVKSVTFAMNFKF